MKARSTIVFDRVRADGFRPLRAVLYFAFIAAGTALATVVLSGVALAEQGGLFGARAWGALALLAVAMWIANRLLKPVMERICVPIVLYLWAAALCVANALALALCARFAKWVAVDGVGAALAGGCIIAAFAFAANLLFRSPRKAQKLVIAGMDMRSVMVRSREDFRSGD